MNVEHSLPPPTTINPKWIKDPNVRVDTIKLIEENKGRTLLDINHRIFFNPLSTIMKIKKNKWGLIKRKSFCTAKETINKTKRQPIE